MDLKGYFALFFTMLVSVSCVFSRTTRQLASLQEPLSILQGMTTTTQTQINVLMPKDAGWQMVLVPQDENAKPLKALVHHTFSRGSSPWVVLLGFFDDLNPESTYELRVTDRNGVVLDKRILKSLNTKKSSVRFALTSCVLKQDDTDSVKIWREMLDHDIDMLFSIGDHVYVDYDSEKKTDMSLDQITADLIWSRYVEARQTHYLYKSPRLVPTLATWDDHDFGFNDADSSFSLARESRSVFQAFWAQNERSDSPDFDSGPGIASAFHGFGQSFYLMDDRFFRVKKRIRSQFEPTEWGKSQENWLIEGLVTHARPAWIFNGVQFFGGYHYLGESFEGDHPQQFKQFISAVKNKVPGVIALGSGDLHLSELMQVPSEIFGYKTYEVTSSGLNEHAPELFWRTFRNSWRMVGANEFNYAIIDSEATEGLNLKLRIRSLGLDKKVIYDRQLSVKKSDAVH